MSDCGQALPKPVVTAVIPVWDHHVQFLPRCLEALRREPLSIALVIVDNDSHVSVAVPETSVLVKLERRRTVGFARNTGLAYVETPFVVFADADDEILPGSIARGVQLLERDSRIAGVVGRSIVHEKDGTVRSGRTPTRKLLRTARFAPALTPLLWLSDFQTSITSTVLRTAVVQHAGGFDDGDVGEDWRLAARLARRGDFVYLDDAVRIYHRHAAAARDNSQRRSDRRTLRRAIWRDCIRDAEASLLQRGAARLAVVGERLSR